jgi:hypothetical protein
MEEEGDLLFLDDADTLGTGLVTEALQFAAASVDPSVRPSAPPTAAALMLASDAPEPSR